MININIFKQHNSVPGAIKVFFVPINTYQIDIYQALINQGVELYSLNFEGNFNSQEYKQHTEEMGKYFLEKCLEIQPDWVYFMLDVETLPLKYIKKAKSQLPNTIFTNWTGDVRDRPKEFVEILGKVIDNTFIVSVGQVPLYTNCGMNGVNFLQAGIDTTKFFKMSLEERQKLPKKYKSDVVFCANNCWRFPGAALRNEVAIKLAQRYGNNFALYGTKWQKGDTAKSARGSLFYFDQNLVYNASKLVISINNYNDIEMYFSARQMVAMASGTLVISKYIPKLEKYFENKKHLVWFNSTTECLKLVDYYLHNLEEADEIGTKGSKIVRQEFSREKFIERMMKILKFK